MGDRSRIAPSQSSVQYRLNPRELIAWVLRRRRRYHVHGVSMTPLFAGEEDVLVKPYRLHPTRPWKKTHGRTRSIHEGDVVVVRHPSRHDFLLIKIVHHVNAKKHTVDIRGLNADASTDSRTFGPVRYVDILGQVTAVLR